MSSHRGMARIVFTQPWGGQRGGRFPVRAVAGLIVGASLLLVAACSSTTTGERAEVSTGATPSGKRSNGLYKVGKPYQIKGIWYYPQINYEYVEEGVASWYGPGFHGQATANGETYNQNDLTAAHKTLPLPTIVRVTNLDNGRSLKLRVNDRGPFVDGRIIDVSRRGAQLLGFFGAGTAHVRVEVDGEESRQLAMALTGSEYPDGSMVASRQTTAPAPVPVIAATPMDPAPVVTAVETPMPADVAPITVASAAAADIGQTSFAYDGSSPSTAAEQPPAWAASPSYQDASYAVPAAQPDNASTYAMAPIDGGAPVDSGSAWVTTAPLGTAPATAAEPAYPRAVHTPAAASANSRAYVQAGAFANPVNADRVRQRLTRLGPVAVVNRGAGGQPLYRVRVGPLTSVGEAEKMLSAVIEAGFPGSQIVVE